MGERLANHVIAIGQELSFEVPEPAAAGYLWQVSVGDGVEVVSNTHYNSDSEGIGSFGTRVVTLKGVKPGEHEVRMQLRRPWEHDQPPTREIVQKVHVKKELAE